MPELVETDELYATFRAGEPESKTTIALVDDHLFDVLDPGTWVFNLDSIATSLSNLCRFNGQIRNFYSVAEHAVRVSKMLESWGYATLVQYLGLHHDDVESIMGDIPSPQKRILMVDGEPFASVEKSIEYSLFSAMGFPTDHPFFDEWWKAVKNADLAVYLEERSERPILGQGLYPNLAKDRYLTRHHELRTKLGDKVNDF